MLDYSQSSSVSLLVEFRSKTHPSCSKSFHQQGHKGGLGNIFHSTVDYR